MRLVCVSDTHGLHAHVQPPDGDVLVHAGDWSRRGELPELRAFDAWLGTLPHRHKIVIAGNHDFCFEEQPAAARAALTHATYLQDSGCEVDGVRFWGSPWQPWFFDWAFNLRRGAPLRAKWALIPDGTHVLVTHGPPHGVLDVTARGEPVGCEELTLAVDRVRPRLHVFGHIHEAFGTLARGGTLFVNASFADLRYRPANRAVVVDVDEGGARLTAGPVLS